MVHSKLRDYQNFNDFVDTMDLLLEYNVNKADPLGAIYDQDPIYLADGDSAIWANGTWAWTNIADSGAENDDDYCFIPFVLGNDTNAVANTGMQASATKQVIIDKVQATEDQQNVAKEFLNWMVYNETAQKMLVEDVNIVPANANNKVEPVDPLSRDMKSKMEAGKTYSSGFVAPSDHWQVLGAKQCRNILQVRVQKQILQVQLMHTGRHRNKNDITAVHNAGKCSVDCNYKKADLINSKTAIRKGSKIMGRKTGEKIRNLFIFAIPNAQYFLPWL